MSSVVHAWKEPFDDREVNLLHAEAFGHPLTDDDWSRQVRLSLGWVIARVNAMLVGFVNVPWDGSCHAFILDTMVKTSMRGHGIGTELVRIATAESRIAGCEWLHVDFESHLEDFYFESCGFRSTKAGVMALKSSAPR